MQRYIFFVNERQQKTAEILVFQGISAVLFFYCGRIVLAKRGSIWHIGGGKGDGTFTPQAWAGSFPPTTRRKSLSPYRLNCSLAGAGDSE